MVMMMVMVAPLLRMIVVVLSVTALGRNGDLDQILHSIYQQDQWNKAEKGRMEYYTNMKKWSKVIDR